MPIPRKRTTVVEEFGSDSQQDGPTSAPTSRTRSTRKISKLPVGTGDLAVESVPTGHEEFRIGSRIERKSDEVENQFVTWTSKNLVVLLGVLFTIIGFGVAGAWYVSKFDSGLSSVQEDLRDVKAKVEKSSSEITRQSVRLDYVERAVQND